MATNLVYRNTDSKNRVETLAATHGPGVPVLNAAGAPAVTLTGSGDYVLPDDTTTYPPLTIAGMPGGGAGLEGKEVTLALDGTWEFDEADIAGTTALTATQGLAIYITPALALTTTVSTNTLFGTVDFPKDYDKTRGMVPVKIGA